MKKVLVFLALGVLALTSCKFEPTVSLSQVSAEVAAAGGEIEVQVSSNCEWKAESNSPDVLVAPAAGVKNGTIKIAVAANETSVVRVAKVNVVATNDQGMAAAILDINQLGVAKAVSVKLAEGAEVSAEDCSFSVTVVATEDWTLSASEGVEFSPASGMSGTQEVKVTLPDNKTNDAINYELKVSIVSDSSVESALSLVQPAITELEYAGETYKVRWLAGTLWMTEPLRYIPEGKTPSDTPSDNSGVWYPYSLEVTYSINSKTGKETASATASPLKDAESVKKIGYLYSANVYLGGVEFGEDNFSSFEGVQGICPDGWHIPTRAESVALFGYAQKNGDLQPMTDENAPIYDATYKSGKYTKAVECGWNPVLSGSVFNGKYNATAVTRVNSDMEDLTGLPAVTYYATSTGSSKTKLCAGMTTFTKTAYPEGRIHIAETNATTGLQVRCVRDAK